MDVQSTDLLPRTTRQASIEPGVSRIALTIDEAAESLGVTRRTIEHEIMKGTLKPRSFGKYKLIGVDALKKLFK